MPVVADMIDIPRELIPAQEEDVENQEQHGDGEQPIKDIEEYIWDQNNEWQIE